MASTDEKLRGWTSWQPSSNPQNQIERVWYEARHLHFLKENRTVYFDGSELVGEIRWRVNEHLWRMKKPPADWKPKPVDREAMEAAFREFHDRKRREREMRAGEAAPALSIRR